MMGKANSRRSTSSQASSKLSTASRSLFSKSSPKASASGAGNSGTSESPVSARTSLLNVLRRPKSSHAITSVTSTNASSKHGQSFDSFNEDDYSDHGSTVASSYASSIRSSWSSRSSSSEDIAKRYENYLETPFVNTTTTIKHSEYGVCTNPNWRWTSHWDPAEPVHPEEEPQPPYYILLSTYLSYLLLIVLGHIRDFFGKRFLPKAYAHLVPHDGYAALNSDFDSFYTRRLKMRLDDCFSRPTTGVAGRTVVCYDRVSHDENNTFQLTGTTTRALNVSSYNYLGFASSSGPCADVVEASLHKYGVSSGGLRHDTGTTDLHEQTEKLVARFLGVESAYVCSMGFATNATTIPALVSKGCLVISDELIHASVRFGVRISGANVRAFKHNNLKHLESLLRESISQGQPRTHRPWKKIMVIVEGLYSMEGTLVPLPQLLELRNKYKFYLYLDEAHSVGALGPNGRGVCDYFGIDPREVDVLMGTFTKSFGAAGGYIAGTKHLIDRLRVTSHHMTYAEAMSPAVCTQIIATMSAIMGVAPPLASPPALEEPNDASSIVSRASRTFNYGPVPSHMLPSFMKLPQVVLNGLDGRDRLRRIAFNSRYLSSALRKLGFVVYGHRDSPIIPLLIYNPAKMLLFSQMMLNRFGADKTPIVIVVVAYPATPLITSRIRFCLSSSHTKHDMDMLLRACEEIGTLLDLKLAKQTMTVEQVIASAEELVASTHV
ncbi:putative component of serine palmitoyltransferase [Kockovaella imperatae]|uniref:serine C-palmitoyltransferase n=1 Tax=Kockovaella imperatae TaxID=4999 RepID=A0A1Y1UB37_9TREE|nr:putative component of serine palmitoyltransferase [Kockovaella imperatae]ORX35222.1 putative component of serine palmitoyltransferase [Kockovaella imperatae]